MFLLVYLWNYVMSRDSTILSILDLTVIKKKRGIGSLFNSKNEEKNNRTGFLVRNMNLTIYRNRIHGIVGESGSGKSLTMKCVLGLIDFSPGIISGNILYRDKKNEIDILPKNIINGNSNINMPWNNWFQKKKNIQFQNEYFIIKNEDLALELKYVPILDSIRVFFVDKKGYCTSTDCILPTRLHNKLVRLKDVPRDNQIAAVSYSYVSDFTSFKVKKRLDKIQKQAQIRGKKVSMILQDPQTFLNPYWSIDKQLKNIINRQRTGLEDTLYIERNFTLRIMGSGKDYPLLLKWDNENLNRHLKQADIWLDGKSHSMLSTDVISIEKGSSHFWGIKTAGRKFTLLIHPRKNTEKIILNWDQKALRSNVLNAVLFIQSNRDLKNINLLNKNSYSFNPEDVNSEGFLHAEIELIIHSGNIFEQKFVVKQGSDNCTLVLGLKKGATDGIDTSFGETQISTPESGFYAGLKIFNEKDSFMLSHKDIRSPVDLYTAEATVTITPKFDQAYIGKINIFTASGKNRHVEFGLLSSATDEEDEHLGEKDITPYLQEGIFEAGFVIEQEGNAIMSPKDLRNLEAGVDIDKEVSSILDKVDLNDEDQVFRRQYPKEISGGQGQRVMISLAMAAKPEVLIADEPTTGLDVTKQTEVVQLFRQYKDQGRTIVLISHDLSFVSHLADYYTIMYAGTDVEHIPNDKMEQTVLLHPYTRRLLEIASSEEEKGFTYIEKDVPDPYRSNLSGCPFEPRCKLKENIPASLDNEHICKQLFPPIIHADSGGIIQTDQLDGKSHFIRCWLFLKT